MIDQSVQQYAKARGFHPQTLERWLRLPIADRESLFELAQTLKLSENHFRDCFDWLEEISLRDRVSLGSRLKDENLSRILTDPRLGRNDKLKRLKDELRRLRFPRLAKIEEEIQRRIREMKLSPEITVKVQPGLEGGAVTVEINTASYGDLKRLAAEASRAIESERMRRIFALLRGDTG